jgi:hypothetical protein
MPPSSSARDRHLQRGRAEDHLHALVQEQDDAEGRQHLREVVAVVEVPEDQEFQQQPDPRVPPAAPAAAPARRSPSPPRRRAEIGAQHVLHAMREVDEVHHAEDQREPAATRNSRMPNCRPVQDASAAAAWSCAPVWRAGPHPDQLSPARSSRQGAELRSAPASGIRRPRGPRVLEHLAHISVWNLPSGRRADLGSQKSCTG